MHWEYFGIFGIELHDNFVEFQMVDYDVALCDIKSVCGSGDVCDNLRLSTGVNWSII